MEIVKLPIGQALTSAAANHILGVSQDIYDEEQEQYQSEINKSLIEGLATLNADGIIALKRELEELSEEKLAIVASRAKEIKGYIDEIEANGDVLTMTDDIASLKAFMKNEPTNRNKAISDAIDELNTTLTQKIDEKPSVGEESLLAVSKDIESVNARVDKLLAEIMHFHSKTSFSAKPEVIFVDSDTRITLSASGTYGSDKAIAIKYQKKNAEGAYVDFEGTTDALSASASYQAIITMKENIDFTLSAGVTAVHPIYYFFAPADKIEVNKFSEIAADYMTDTNKVSTAKTSANGTYTKKNTVETEDGLQCFYLCVPSDVAKPSTFKMGGQDYNIQTSFDFIYDGCTYKVYVSGGEYGKNDEVSVNVN